MPTHSGDFNPSVKASLFTETSEQADEFLSCPHEVSLMFPHRLICCVNDIFFDILSKYLAISILKYIQQDVNIKYNLYKIYFIIYSYDNSSCLKCVIPTLPFMGKKTRTTTQQLPCIIIRQRHVL